MAHGRDGGALDAGISDAGADAAASVDPEVATLRQRARQVRALLAGSLDPSVEPQSLFDTPLGNARAVAVEVARLRALTHERLSSADAGTDAAADARTIKGRTPAAPKPRKGDTPDAQAPAPEPRLDARAQTLYDARIELDAARLVFLSLSAPERKKILEEHQRRRGEVAKQGATVDQAQQRAEAAAIAKQKALEEAKRARSEAARLLAEEQARLLGVKEAQARFEASLGKSEERTAKRAEEALAWRRRVSGVVSERIAGKTTAEEADTLYEELRKSLRSARDELAGALDSLTSSELPRAGPDRLDTAGATVDRTAIDALRRELETQEQKLQIRESKMRWARASSLLEQVESLNRDRLALYPHLTDDKRAGLTGFNTSGIDQARAELRQVSLVTRFQAQASWNWIRGLRHREGDRTGEVVATLSVLKLLALLAVFLWWRRRAPSLIAALRERTESLRQENRSRRVVIYAERAVSLLERAHGPAAWLAFVWGTVALAGPAVSGLYAVQMLWIVLGWTLGGNIIVHVIDVGFAEGDGRGGRRSTDQLRYQSLRLVGRVIVTVGLFLSLTTHLVGQGTIYSWVLSTFWFLAIPIALVIIRWWQPVVFERLGAARKKSVFVQWVLGQSAGWKRFPAAAAGGVYLIGQGVARTARTYVSTFEMTRRVLAYLFRREVAKQAREHGKRQTDPLPEALYASLGPQEGMDTPVPGVGDAEIASIAAAIDAPGGGVFAVVGERGLGKSMLLDRILRDKPSSVRVGCPVGGAAPLARELRRALGLDADASEDALRDALAQRGEDSALLIDDAHRLVRPTIGGLDDFDRIVALARDSSDRTTWVFCLGAVIWQYVERARGTRPVFDEVIHVVPWREENIAALLKLRSERAGITPLFDDLVGEEEDDEDLRREQLARTEVSYYRLLWDYAAGNPAIAVHFWRESLRVDHDGDVRVQLFNAPNTADIESLPDASLFVLRAVVQLELALPDDIVVATMLPSRQVHDTLRYASFRGYLEQTEGRYRVAWTWLRAITRVLQRRHLLSGGT